MTFPKPGLQDPYEVDAGPFEPVDAIYPPDAEPEEGDGFPEPGEGDGGGDDPPELSVVGSNPTVGAGTTSNYQVDVVNDGGAGDFTDAVTLSVASPTTLTVADLTVEHPEGTSLTLTQKDAQTVTFSVPKATIGAGPATRLNRTFYLTLPTGQQGPITEKHVITPSEGEPVEKTLTVTIV